MPWLKHSDNAARHPRVTGLRDAPKADRRSKWEVYGFTMALLEESAAHLTDGRVDRDTIETLGGPRWRTYIAQMIHTGIVTEKKDRKTGAVYWQLVDDPDWISLRSKAQVNHERQRDRDRKNPELAAAVRLRDGDGCRYCRTIVNWHSRSGDRQGSLDHREPGKAATVETYVVACFGCNRARSDNPNADEEIPLKPTPSAPFYSPSTAKFLAENGHQVKASRS